MEVFLTYAAQVAVAILAFFALWKDASDYGELSKKYGKHIVWFCAALTVVLAVASIVLTHISRKQAIQDKIDASQAALKSDTQIDDLSKQVVRMSQDRTNAEKGFRESFSQLSDESSAVANRSCYSKTSQRIEQDAG